MKEVTIFKKVLISHTEKLLDEYNDITSHMQPYDVAAFDTELNSAYSYYSLRHFDEESFQKTAEGSFGLDITSPVINELLSEYIGNYSRATIMVKALHDYIRCNNIMTEVDNEGMVYNS
jgi:hypothetical protein